MATMNDVSFNQLDEKENNEIEKTYDESNELKTLVQPDYKNEESASRASNTKRMKDIHLDGAMDNMPCVDPYMLDDKELDFQSEIDGNAGSIYSDLSESCSKYLQTSHMKPHSAASSQPRSSIASRARQIKDHEAEPFLSIDLMPQGSTTKSESKTTGPDQARSSLRGSSCQTLISAISSESVTQRSGKNSVRSGKGKILSAASSYSLLVKDCPKPNHHVKLPFKQGTGSKTSAKWLSRPLSHGITERTAMATHVFNKILEDQKPSKTTYIQGRLLKARLKPLEPVQPSVPTIHQCRGIIAETRSYGQSQSRTFQRWKAIMAGGSIAHQHLHYPHLQVGMLTDGAMSTNNDVDTRDIRSGSVCESVHQTSQASSSSSPTPHDLLNSEIDNEQNCVEQGVERREHTTMIGTNYDLESVMGQRNLTSKPLQGSPSGSGQENGVITDPSGSDCQSIMPQANTFGVVHYKDLAQRKQIIKKRKGAEFSPIEPSVGFPCVNSNEKYGNESVISGSISFQPSCKENTSSAIQQQTVPGNKRPQSASYLQKAVIPQSASRRPQTAGDSATRKAVRFADQSILSTQVVNGKQERDTSTKNKKSCRPHSLDSGFHDREDPEDDHSECRGSKTFLTQQPVESSTCSTAQADSSPQTNGSGKKTALKNSSQLLLEYTINESKKTKMTQEGAHWSTPQEMHGPKSAYLTYVQEESGLSKKPSMDKKNSGSNIKRRHDDRCAEYINNRRPKTKGNNIKNSNTRKFGYSTNAKQEQKSDIDDDTERQLFNKHTELHRVMKKFFKPANISIKSHKCNRSQHAQSYKAKVLKLLQAKANARPFSATTYSDRVISEKKMASKRPIKNLRPKSAEMFAEKSLILSKHGLLKSHTKSVSTNCQEPNSGFNLIFAKPMDPQSLKTVKQVESDYQVKQVNAAAMSETRTTHSSSRSKVTFASNKDQRKTDEFQLFSTSGLRVRNSSGKQCDNFQGSILSQDSDRTLLMGGNVNEILDADIMWAELSSDDSDNGMREDSSAQILATEEDFFMAKFDLLNMQFEAVKAELRLEKLKSALKQGQDQDYDSATFENSIASQQPALPSTNQNEKIFCLNSKTVEPIQINEFPHHLSSPHSIFLTHADYMSHDNVTAESHRTTLECSKSYETETHQESQTECQASSSVMFEYQKPQLTREALLSSQLYRKTNVFVEVSSQDRTRSSSITKRKESPYHTLKVLNSNQQYFQKESHHEDGRKSNDKFLRVPSSNSTLARMTDQEKEFEMCKHQTQKKMQRDYPMLLGIKIESQPLDLNQYVKKNIKFGTETARVVEENLQQNSNYQEMLQAYRRHCIEDRDDSESDSDATSFSQLDKSKQSKKTQFNLEFDCNEERIQIKKEKKMNSNMGMMSTNSWSRSRPVSATTNGSGWKNDCHPSSSPKEFVETPLVISHFNNEVDQSGNEISLLSKNSKNLFSSSVLIKDPIWERNQLPRKGFNSNNLREQPIVIPDQGTLKNSSDQDMLTVVAQAKKITKKSGEVAIEEPMTVLCKFPPLCFKLNARPPNGFLYYFAYGPNMSCDRLCTYLQCENPPPRFWALLFGFGLVFNKKGTESSAAGIGGFSNLEYNVTSSVEGCIFQLTSAQLKQLDAFMEYPRSQEHVVLPVWMSNCSSSVSGQGLGVAQYCVPAVTYIALNEAMWTEPIYANEFSVSQCLKAASEMCSKCYQEHLTSFSTIPQQHDLPLTITAT